MQDLSEIVGRCLRIYLLIENERIINDIQSLWPSDRISWTVFSNGRSALERIFSEPPDMVIAEQLLPEISGLDVLRMLRAENIYRQICAILILGDGDIAALPSASLNVDELVILPAPLEEIRLRVELALYRTTVTLDANPLTRLPGNTTIINTVQRLFAYGTDFALAYADLDNFKPYNDKYGFSRGDEILLMAARIIGNTVSMQQCAPSFVGHIGGDDFVFILPPDAMEQACQSIISDFDAIVPSFYDPKERAHGYIVSHDRQGNEQVFPILSISIAVVRNIAAKYTCYAELAHAAGQLKGITKDTLGSVYVIDRRK